MGRPWFVVEWEQSLCFITWQKMGLTHSTCNWKRGAGLGYIPGWDTGLATQQPGGCEWKQQAPVVIHHSLAIFYPQPALLLHPMTIGELWRHGKRLCREQGRGCIDVVVRVVQLCRQFGASNGRYIRFWKSAPDARWQMQQKKSRS